MLRRDILDAVGGFKPHLTEDFELTLRIYLAGHKILYREDLSVPAECPSRLTNVIRQTYRWSLGTTACFVQNAPLILMSRRLSKREKLDMFLFGTFYFQAPLFLAANIIALATMLGGTQIGYTLSPAWPILLYLTLSGPTSAAAGLYKDSSLRRSHWILYTILLAYIAAPVQTYGVLKGLFSGKSYWHRTPKTGLITDNSEVPKYAEQRRWDSITLKDHLSQKPPAFSIQPS